ncbi:MAG: hypothetical protein M1829_005754 [Trizodia sp. TS-e1964]|nr:MAG: hypothetical protein M1829_005754 [Trizodia sp. TS-e1964]
MSLEAPSEDVNDFLKRIQEMGDPRSKEEDSRNRRLEDEILQGRKERQARRAERARSLSPTKESPANTPPMLRSQNIDISLHNFALTPTAVPSPLSQASPHQSSSQISTIIPRNTMLPESGKELVVEEKPAAARNKAPIHETDIMNFHRSSSVRPSPSTAIAPARSSPLSWQRRPNSQSLDDSRARPLSMLALENSVARSPVSTPEPSALDDLEVSRSQIAQSLGSKDPSWFRQTPDRGVGSAAYRRNRDDPVVSLDKRASKMQLPGMAQHSATEPERVMTPPVSESARSASPSQGSSIHGSAGWRNTMSSTSSFSVPSSREGRSILPVSRSQRLEAPISDAVSAVSDDHFAFPRSPAMSPSQDRILIERSERSPSPTKGLGGFVQSAMLKRSDSVNKRWSAQSNAARSRGNSVVGSRTGLETPGTVLPRPPSPQKFELRPSTSGGDSSPNSRSRPQSSHGILINSKEADELKVKPSSLARDSQSPLDDDEPAKLSLAAHRLLSEAKPLHQEAQPAIADLAPPSSPSKSSDYRRWSPTKSTWLESALSKGPEPPKPKTQAPPQPSWMSEISKAKQQRGSVDNRCGRGTSNETSTDGLLRTPLLGSSISSINSGGPVNGYKSVDIKPRPLGAKPSSEIQSLSPPRPSNVDLLPPSKPTKPSTESLSSILFQDQPSSKAEILETVNTKPLPPATKPKPEAPLKNDLRSHLRSRQTTEERAASVEPEFKNVFGNLKRTKTQNYVAPDELKSNILRGKAGLAVTGGPQKSERRDEFKESILRKKEEMKSKAADGTGSHIANSASLTCDSPARRSGPPTPEAIARHKSLKGKPKPSPPAKQPSAPGRLQGRDTSKLAGKLNPALAALIARAGPPVESGGPSLDLQPQPELAAPSIESKEEEHTQLTHLTKSRAKGPKRRLPNRRVEEPFVVDDGDGATRPKGG